MYSQSRQELFLSYPSLNTSVNERTRLFAYHHLDILASEMDEIFQSNRYLETHLEILGDTSDSGLSLRRLISLQITIVKLPDIE